VSWKRLPNPVSNFVTVGAAVSGTGCKEGAGGDATAINESTSIASSDDGEHGIGGGASNMLMLCIVLSAGSEVSGAVNHSVGSAPR
jgi:hypothetical protein